MADTYYDDQKRVIAIDIAGLLIYFNSLQGVRAAQNVVYGLACPMYALIQVVSDGVLPKYIYKNGLTPANRIYLRVLTKPDGIMQWRHI